MRRLLAVGPVSLLALLQAGPLLPCAVCFGQAGAGFQRGFFWGILLLLLLPLAIVALVAFKIVQAVRRKESLEGGGSHGA